METTTQQSGLFGRETLGISEIDYLRECPWLYGEYANKLWRHSLHAISSYPSKLRPQIAYLFIDSLSKPGDVVFDPFSGSGTVCLEACLNGRVGIGVDLSPYAYILTDFKTSPPDIPEILRRVNELSEGLSEPVDVTIPNDVSAFFHPDTLTEIVNFRSKLDDNIHLDRCVLSILCGILHGGRPGFLSRKTRDIIPLKPMGEIEHRALIPRLINKIDRVYKSPLPGIFVKGKGYLGDSRKIGYIDSESVDLIVTSPPFFDTTEFVRHNWLRLWLIGWGLETQKGEAKNFIGEKNMGSFEDDLKSVISECMRVLKPGGRLVMHGGKKGKINMTDFIKVYLGNTEHKVEAIIDERVDHANKHALRKTSGLSHDFLIAKKSRV